MDHARMLLADRFGSDAAWLALRWCRMLALLGKGNRSAVLAAMRSHVAAVGDRDDLDALAQIETALDRWAPLPTE